MTNEAGCEFDLLEELKEAHNYTPPYTEALTHAIEYMKRGAPEGWQLVPKEPTGPQVKADVVDIQVLKYDVAYKFGQAHNGVIDYIFENYNITRKIK
jgi:hypothetical protein